METIEHDLWVEKYRPQDVNNYVWRDDLQKDQIIELLKKENLPHLLFSGSPGTGKTTLAKVLLNELKVNKADVLELNGSVENKIEIIRDKITNFVSLIGFGGTRYVLYDEADYLTPASQAGLRNLMETFSKNARFILTANYPHKIIPALKSRLQHYHFHELNKEEFAVRVAQILDNENVSYDVEQLMEFIEATYPDLRKCINLLQQYSVDGKLENFSKDDAGQPDWYEPMIEKFKQGQINEARKIIIKNIQPEEYDDIYRFLYDNLEFFGDNEDSQMAAILIIREGLVNSSLCADKEINLSATLVKLSNIGK